VELASGLDFYDQLLVDDHVQALFRELLSLVEDTHRDFAANPMFARDELPLQCHCVDVFKESKPESVIDLEECADDRVSESFFKEVSARHSVKMAGHITNKSSILRRSTPKRHSDQSE